MIYMTEEVSTEEVLAEIRHNQWHDQWNDRLTQEA